jgi:hypothetical protein
MTPLPSGEAPSIQLRKPVEVKLCATALEVEVLLELPVGDL